MQNKFFAMFAVRAHALVKIHILPAVEQFRFLLRKAAAHREVGFRQEYRIAIIVFLVFSHGVQDNGGWRGGKRPIVRG